MNESIWDIDAQAGEGLLNPIALTIFERGLRGQTPLVPPEFEGALVAVTDISLCFEVYLNLLEETLLEQAKTSAKKEQEKRSMAKLREELRRSFAPLDGGLIKLSADIM